MQIFVRAESTHVLNVEKCDTISSIKSFIEQEEGTASLCQYVTFQGVPLNDDDTFESCSIDEMSNLDICVRLLGGKVHGSLARAGKVKSQTPKVEKGEKKKKPTGRAKRRIQYNRRFVNVVVGMGKKKGPNSNS
eukprot:Sdes_comp10997_c0_seq1m2637